MIEVIRDSFILNYSVFVLIIFLFKDEVNYLFSQIVLIYKWYPFIQCALFWLSFNDTAGNFSLFGDTHLLFFKFGDIAVHLCIATLLFLNHYIKFKSKSLLVLFVIAIVYIYMIAASYNRAGMLGYILSMMLFLYLSVNSQIKEMIYKYLKWLPVAVIVALPFYLHTKVDENFQGRKPGLEQLKENITSIFISNADGSLGDNKVWRLVWWGKIIGYTFGGNYFFSGKGLGVNLRVDDEIDTEELSELRSPHNFHLNILARYGVPVFFLWLYWIYLILKDVWVRRHHLVDVMMGVIFFMFIFNASFDVYLEGPMGAFPFWTFVGLFLAISAYDIKLEAELKDV
ncbi:MAG: O-antigen ligase family protein [Bacteroidota bacterium]|nr:O-antigen ligase family protein [Bacteroidota bacterium]